MHATCLNLLKNPQNKTHPNPTLPPKTTQNQQTNKTPPKKPRNNTKQKSQQYIFTFSNIASFKIGKTYF